VTVARGLVVAALLAAAAAVAVVLLGDGSSHRYTLVFQNAGQLVPGNDVQVGGRRVGAVRALALTEERLARVEIEVEEPYAPLRVGTQATIRALSLSGVANRYVALSPGPGTGAQLPDGARLTTEDTTSVVDVDQLFNTLDPATRRDLQAVVQGLATQYAGKGEEAGEAIEALAPALSGTRRVLDQLDRDEGALTRFLVDTGRAMSALAERRAALSALVADAAATTTAIGREDAALERALALLPGTLRRGTGTFAGLRATLDELDPLVAAAGPATRELAPFLRELRPLVADARPTLRDLRRLVRREGPANDAVDAARRLPALQRAATPALANARSALVRAQPVLAHARPYAPDLVGWLRDFGSGAAPYDANGHYARVQPIFSAFAFTDSPGGGTLSPVPPSRRFEGFQRGALRRCPGAASQPPPDGSAPFTDGGRLDCDPTLAPPGP